MQLPLFPLPVILFPGALIPLHIFEPRYQALLAHVVEGDHLFAMVPPGQDAPPADGAIGTVARVRAVQPLAEGRSNIVVSGEERVRLNHLVPSDTLFLVGEFEPLPDLEETQIPSDADLDRLRSLAERYGTGVAALHDTEPQANFSSAAAKLTFQVGALVEWDFEQKQRFLAIRSPRERVVRLLATLPRLLADLEGRVIVHRRASSNGTGHRG